MGEIGYNRDEFLYQLRWWEVRAIIEGYRKRERTYCLMTRWSTYMMMNSGMADLKKAGIYGPEDLLKLPWDKDMQHDEELTDEEVEEQRRRIQEANKKSDS